MINQEFKTLGRKYQMLPNFGIYCKALGELKVASFCACVRRFCSVSSNDILYLLCYIDFTTIQGSRRYERFDHKIIAKRCLYCGKLRQCQMTTNVFLNSYILSQESSCSFSSELFLNKVLDPEKVIIFAV